MFYLFVYYFIIRKSHWILVYDTSHIQTQSYWLSFSLPPSHWCRKEQMQSGRKMPGSLGCHQCWWLHISMQEIVSGWWKFIPDFGHSKYDNKTQEEKKKKKKSRSTYHPFQPKHSGYQRIHFHDNHANSSCASIQGKHPSGGCILRPNVSPHRKKAEPLRDLLQMQPPLYVPWRFETRGMNLNHLHNSIRLRFSCQCSKKQNDSPCISLCRGILNDLSHTATFSSFKFPFYSESSTTTTTFIHLQCLKHLL